MGRKRTAQLEPPVDMTFYQAWEDLNMRFILADEEDPQFMEVPHQTGHHWTMEGFGFGLPEVVPPWIATNGSPDRRVKLLHKRYVEPLLWSQGMMALQNTNKLGSNRKNLGAITVHLHRREKDPDKMPDGGGCLIALVFSRFGYHNSVHMYARASEITKALLGDLYFSKYLIEQAIIEGELDWDIEKIHLKWTAVYGSQKTYFAPLLMLESKGDDFVKEFFSLQDAPGWRRSLDRYFWRYTIFPERVKWPPRRRWAEMFLESSKYSQDEWIAFGEEFGKLEEWPFDGPRTPRWGGKPPAWYIEKHGDADLEDEERDDDDDRD